MVELSFSLTFAYIWINWFMAFFGMYDIGPVTPLIFGLFCTSIVFMGAALLFDYWDEKNALYNIYTRTGVASKFDIF